MIRGFVTGVIWGGVVAATGLAVVSQVAPLPMRDQVAGSGATPAAPVVVAPEAVDPPEATAPLAEPAAPDPAPEMAEPAAPEVVEATPPPAEALQPEILQKVPADAAEDAPVDGAAAGETGAAPDEAVADAPIPNPAQPEEDVAESPEETVVEQMLAQPGLVEDAPGAAPLVPAVPEAGVTVPGAMAEAIPGLGAADAPAAPGAEAAPQRMADPPAPEEALLQPMTEPATPPSPSLIVPDAPLPTLPEALAPEAEEDMAAAAPAVRTDRLPRIGDEPEPETEEMAGADAALLPEATLGTTPLELFRRDFDNPDAKPLFSIILIDEGIPADERARLAALPFPVTFALDPLAAESASAAMVYRAAGQEVAMLASGIPQGATAGDLEQTFQALDMAMPEAVALVDRLEGGFQDTLELARQAVPIVAEQGRGIVTYDRGLNSADQVARREGVPRATIFRVLDAEAESIPKMRNYLDRAAFKAAQEGQVLVIGRARAETVAAILEWTVEGRAASVALAPLSAVLDTVPNP